MSKKITDAIQEMKDQAERAVSDIAVAADPALTAVKAELAAAEKQAAPTVKKATAAVAEELQQAKIKTEPYVKQARRKAEPAIRTAQAAAKKAEPTLKAAAKKAEPTLKAAKDAGTQLAHVLVPEVYVQLGEHQFTCTDIVERCRADFRAANKGGIHSCKVYIKPEDGMAYYVINRIEGKIKLN